jgi:hypothetical protein
MAKIVDVISAVQNNLKLSGDVLVSINSTLEVSVNLGDSIKAAIEQALAGDIGSLSQALTDINSSNSTLSQAVGTLGQIKDVLAQSIPSIPSEPSEPTEPLPPTEELPEFPEIEIPVVVAPTPDGEGLPGSVAIDVM